MASIAILIHPGIGGEALAEYMKAVWTAFPDFRVEVLDAGEIGPGLVAHHWMIKGTNTGRGRIRRFCPSPRRAIRNPP
jgi:hypothetical protein